jgi:hypothetical protein
VIELLRAQLGFAASSCAWNETGSWRPRCIVAHIVVLRAATAACVVSDCFLTDRRVIADGRLTAASRSRVSVATVADLVYADPVFADPALPILV